MSPTGFLSAAVAEVAPDEFEDVWLLAHPDITAAAARTAAAAITMRRYVLMAPLLKLVAVDPLRRMGKTRHRLPTRPVVPYELAVGSLGFAGTRMNWSRY